MTALRILIIEDEIDLCRVLEYNLRQAGFDVVTASQGKEGLKLAQSRPPDLVLLDLMLPDVPGTEICRTLKSDAKTAAVPIMMVTAKGEEVDRVVGFELGADDYVVKPFSVRELILRVRAILRRGAETLPNESNSVQFGCLKVDQDAYRIFVDSEEVQLTAVEFRLLTTLMSRQNRVQTRETLLQDVWGVHLNVETRTVDTHIKRLREKLKKGGAYIQTVRGVGYRFAESPEESD